MNMVGRVKRLGMAVPLVPPTAGRCKVLAALFRRVADRLWGIGLRKPAARFNRLADGAEAAAGAGEAAAATALAGLRAVASRGKA
jgi:hypothetical protein